MRIIATVEIHPDTFKKKKSLKKYLDLYKNLGPYY